MTQDRVLSWISDFFFFLVGSLYRPRDPGFLITPGESLLSRTPFSFSRPPSFKDRAVAGNMAFQLLRPKTSYFPFPSSISCGLSRISTLFCVALLFPSYLFYNNHTFFFSSLFSPDSLQDKRSITPLSSLSRVMYTTVSGRFGREVKGFFIPFSSTAARVLTPSAVFWRATFRPRFTRLFPIPPLHKQPDLSRRNNPLFFPEPHDTPRSGLYTTPLIPFHLF